MYLPFLSHMIAAQPMLLELTLSSAVLLTLALAVRCSVWSRAARAPRTVSLLWLTALFAPIAVFVPFETYTLYALPAPAQVDPEMRTTVLQEVVVSRSTGATSPTAIESSRRSQSSAAAVANGLFIIWLVGVACIALRHAFFLHKLTRLICSGAPAEPPLEFHLLRVAADCGLRQPPRLVICDVDAPCVAGAFRPVILLPRWLANSEKQRDTLDWVLRHECMHVRLRDPWANAARTLTETLLWFHPLARWTGRQWESAAERACDAALVRTPTAARDYARSLYRLLENLSRQRAPHHAYTLGATRTQIGVRICALLTTQDYSARPQRLGVFCGIAVVMAAVAVVGVRCESPVVSAAPEAQDWDLRLGNTELEMTDDVSVWYLKAEGNFRFAPQRRGLQALSHDAHMRLSERGPRGTTTLNIEPHRDNTPRYNYRVGGKATPFDDAGRDWMRNTLDQVGLKER